MVKKLALLLAILLISLLAACAPAVQTQEAMLEAAPTDPVMKKSATPEMMEEGTPGSDAMLENTQAPMMDTETPQAGRFEETESIMLPAWFSAPLVDARSGETFQLTDFEGKVVLVEPFAQWCSTCLRQQKEVVRLHELLGMRDDLVSVSLGVDTNEDASNLKEYTDKHGFEWRFSIASPETAREIGNLYGTQFLNPPSAPLLIIDRKGEAHPLPFGVKSAEDLQGALLQFLDEGM